MTQDELVKKAYDLGIVRWDVAKELVELITKTEREALVLLLRNLADDHTPSECADMICALQSLGEIRARGEA